MRAVYDMIEDEDVLPYASAPQVIPAPVPPLAEAPVVPNAPIPAVDPVQGADPVSDPESPREDTDPSEYSADHDFDDLGEGDIVVDWDPAVDPALEIQGNHPAPMGPIIALDPEDIDMEADAGEAAEDYAVDLGSP